MISTCFMMHRLLINKNILLLSVHINIIESDGIFIFYYG